jgi:DNA polymerase-1
MNVIVDGMNVCYRAGVVGSLTDEQGNPTGIIYVALQMLHKIAHRLKPSRIYFMWDRGPSQWRKNLYPEYKTHREKSKEENEVFTEIMSQINEFRDNVLPLLPIIQWQVQGIEADDLVAAAINFYSEYSDEECLLISTDKDFYQLLDSVDVWHSAKEEFYTKEDLEKEFGFKPCLWTLYRAMTGDPSDNIRGIDGIGPKTAQKIVSGYGFDWMKYSADNKEQKVAKKLTAGIDVVERNILLMDFNAYPEAGSLLEDFEDKHEEDHCFKEKELKKYVFKKQMFSILREWNKWVAPFRFMEDV